jgi:hypothetical protein
MYATLNWPDSCCVDDGKDFMKLLINRIQEHCLWPIQAIPLFPSLTVLA